MTLSLPLFSWIAAFARQPAAPTPVPPADDPAPAGDRLRRDIGLGAAAVDDSALALALRHRDGPF